MKTIMRKGFSSYSRLFLSILSFCLMFCLFTFQAHASDLDALIGEGEVVQEGESVIIDGEDTSTNPFRDDNTSGADALMDAINKTSGISDESVEKAAVLTAPIIAFFNLVSAILLLLLMGAIGVVTCCDLLFIGVPLVRPLLHPMYNQMVSGVAPAGGGMMPMGGGFGGFGSRYGYGGGMAMGAGMQQQAQPTGHRWQWVSDEAVQCIGLANPQPQQQMGMGMPMGMGMGMQMGAQQPQQPLQGKMPIFAYLKKRSLFLVLFAFAAVFLTSSILTGFGLKLFSFVQEGVANWF